MTLDIAQIRRDFPILGTEVRGKPLVYLDNAATTLKPRSVVDAVSKHYLLGASNVHRGLHYLSEEATRLYEGTRENVRSFINAKHLAEIIFTSGTTASINLVAKSFGARHVKAGDEVLISHMEHHSNIVPWQMLCEQVGATLRIAPIDDHGDLKMDEFARLVTPRTKIVSIVAVSNALGTINPLAEIVKIAKRHGATVVLDAAQMVAHMPIDVQELGCDFLAFSGHKIFAPTGTGVLYGRRELLDEMPPLMGGGDMIRSVTFEKTTYAPSPAKFEAGTPNIGGMIGLGAAIDYVRSVGLSEIAAQEQSLLDYGTSRLAEVPGLRLIGTSRSKTSILSFTLGDVHPHDIGTLLDQEGVAIRAGHHCTQPLMARFKVPATARASLSFYNVREDIDVLARAINKVRRLFE